MEHKLDIGGMMGDLLCFFNREYITSFYFVDPYPYPYKFKKLFCSHIYVCGGNKNFHYFSNNFRYINNDTVHKIDLKKHE